MGEAPPPLLTMRKTVSRLTSATRLTEYRVTPHVHARAGSRACRFPRVGELRCESE